MSDLAALLDGRVWAMEESALRRLVARTRALPTIAVSAADLEARAADVAPVTVPPDVALVPLVGVLGYRSSGWDWLFGGMSVARFMADMRRAASDRKVKSIVIDVDSPGGSIDGIPEAADLVRRIAKVKPVVAIANTIMASAAYWIPSGATEIVASPSSLVGSIGAYVTHVSEARALDKIGLDVTIIKAGKFKAEGHPAEPLGDDARAHVQEIVDDGYRLFVEAVALGRHTSRERVVSGYGEGRVLTAEAARKARLVDRIGTIADVLTRASAFGAERFERERDERIGPSPFVLERRQRMAARQATYEAERSARNARRSTPAQR